MTITLHTTSEAKLRDAAPALAAALDRLVSVFESEYGCSARSPVIDAARAALREAGI